MSRPVINVTPLIDVLLVLLIIFMVVTPVKPSRFEARIPEKPAGPEAAAHPHTIVVTLTDRHQLRLNNETVEGDLSSPQALISRLESIFTQREQNFVAERTVFIKAPQSASYGAVARVIDIVKMAGAKPVSLQIDSLDR